MLEPTLRPTQAASHGVSRRSKDSDPAAWDGYGFHPTRSAFIALRVLSCGTASKPKSASGPSCAYAPLQRTTSGNPRHPPPSAWLAPCFRSRAVLPLLDSCCPTTRSQHGGSACWGRIPPPPRATCGVWLPPSRLSTRPCGPRRLSAPHTSRHLEGAGASMGFTLHGVSFARDRYSSRSPCPLAVSPRVVARPEGRSSSRCVAFRAFFPRRIRSICTSRGKPPSAPTVDPVLGFRVPSELAPARSGSRFGRGASPRTLGWGDVPVRLGLRVSGVERVGQPISGPPALMGFVTS